MSEKQVTPYFSMHRNPLDRIAMRRLRDAGLDAYMVAAWHVAMWDIATNASTFGEFTTDVRSFVRSCGGVPTPEQDGEHARVWRLFEHVGLVELDGDPAAVDQVLGLPAEFRVHVPDVFEVNTPRRPAMSSTERSRKWRERQRETNPEGRDGTEPPSPRDGAGTRWDGEGTGDAEPTTQPPNHPTTTTNARGGGGGDEMGTTETSLPVTHPSSTKVQTSRARTQLGPAALLVERLISDAEHDRGGKAFTEAEAMAYYYRPALQLLAEFGPQRLKDALGEAARNGATRMQYVATVCRSSQRTTRQKQHAKHLATDNTAALRESITGSRDRGPEKLVDIADIIPGLVAPESEATA